MTVATVPFRPATLPVGRRRRPIPAPHYPPRADPTVRLPGAPDWSDWGRINGYVVQLAAQLEPPPRTDGAEWRRTSAGIWVGLRYADGAPFATPGRA